MLLRVRCLLCDEVLECFKNETSILLEHVKDKHPDIKMSRIPNKDHTTEKLFKSTEKITEKKNITTSTDKQPSYNTCRCIHSDGTADSIDSLQKIRKTTPKKNLRNKSEVKKAEHRKKLYITSIEKWRPGRDKITCLKCGITKRPVIRSYAEKVATSPAGAACLLSFWPFCFMPFLFSPSTRHMLHCGICGYMFGEYDRNLLKIKPMNLIEMQAENIVKD